MRIQKYWYIISLILLSTMVFGQATSSPPAKKKWFEVVDVSGFVDVYYNYTANNRQGNQADPAGTFHGYNKQFAINAVELDFEKIPDKSSPWGFRMDLQNGTNNVFQERPYYSTSNTFNMNMLQQAYVSMYFNIGKGLTVDVGKMSTHLGNELLESKDNINYTIGYIFFNTIPFIHTGLRATYTFNDNWTGTFFLYNSIMGTGFNNPFSPYKNDGTTTNMNMTTDQATTARYVDPTRWTANDSLNNGKAVGTQLKGNLVKDRVKLIWNTSFANDYDQGRIKNSTFSAMEYLQYHSYPGANTSYLKRPNSNYKNDYWFINHVSLIFTPSDKVFILLDWTFGERSGAAAEYYAAYVNPGNKVIDFNDDKTGDMTMNRDGHKTKRIYNSYGIFAKYTFTDKWALGFRYEYIDDSRYGGPLVVNAPLYAQSPAGRYDYNSTYNKFAKPQGNYGQIRTLTFTPTYTMSENLIVKLDLRRDYGPGEQFIDEKGRPASYQNGAILGIVAKF